MLLGVWWVISVGQDLVLNVKTPVLSEVCLTWVGTKSYPKEIPSPKIFAQNFRSQNPQTLNFSKKNTFAPKKERNKT